MDYVDVPKTLEMIKQVKIDGRKVDFPLKKENLRQINPNYQIFESLDYSLLENIKDGTAIEDSKTGYVMQRNLCFLHMYHKGVDLCELHVDFLNKQIEGIKNANTFTMYKSDIRVNGIGRGNTFNEMYEIFGIPSVVDYTEYSRSVRYIYTAKGRDGKAVFYRIEFERDHLMFNPNLGKEYARAKGWSHSRNNVITGVNIICDPLLN